MHQLLSSLTARIQRTLAQRLLPAPEVLVDGGQFAVIRPRPSYQAVLGEDRIPPWLTES